MADLKAGRELDALIAKKVMGWRRMTYAERYAPRNPGSHGYGADRRLTGFWHSSELDSLGIYAEVARAEYCDDYYEPSEAWSPSTLIEDAWWVVDAIRHKYGGALLHLHRNGDDTWWAIFGKDEDPGETGDTAPHAICLAALKTAL